MNAQLGFFMLGHLGVPGKSGMWREILEDPELFCVETATVDDK